MSFDVHPILEPGQSPTRGVWYAIAPEEDEPDSRSPPSSRVGANVNFIQVGKCVGRVLLSAGANPDGPYSDLYQLTLGREKMQWSLVASQGLSPRYEHASFITNSSLYVFAGANPAGSVNDLWMLHLDGNSQWKEIKATGSVPIPRTYHSSSSFAAGHDKLVVFSGGREGTTPVTDQMVHLFNPSTNEWSILPTSGSPPSPRQGHVAAVVGSALFIHGGMAGGDVLSDLYCIHLDTLKWSSLEVGGACPPPLAAHGCAVMGTSLYIFGGLSPAGPGAVDTLYRLDTDSLMWEKLSVSGPPPPSRLDHAMCSIKIPIALAQRGETNPGIQGLPPKLDQTDISEKKDLKQKCCSVENESTEGSFQAVTIIDSMDQNSSSLQIEQVSKELHTLSMDEGNTIKGAMLRDGGDVVETEDCDWVSALFVFGGMDTLGNIHKDSFIIVP